MEHVNIPILIPAYKPDNAMILLINELRSLGIKNIIVVRDGGGTEFDEIFNKVKSIEGCHLVVHATNLGKGRALKSGINYYLSNNFNAVGLVTADADGQHLAKDIISIAKALHENNNSLILGVREFDKDVPFRSKFGNTLTRFLFSFLVGKKVSDTQTGLRGIPNNCLLDMLRLSGEKYEYEMNMLVETKVLNISIKEVHISTVYIENNRSSHFNPLIDSIKIYTILFKYVTSSLMSFIIDYLAFVIIFKISNSLALASYLSRGLSMSFNYGLNKKIVFKHNSRYIKTLSKYSLLAIFSITASYLILKVLNSYFGISVIIYKVLIEILLFFFNFYIQNKFIFKKK